MGYHRYFTHRSFQTNKAVEYILAFISCASGEGGPIEWVVTHRRHHALSDQEGDPHSPKKGFWWAHFTWMLYRDKFLITDEGYKKYAPEMYKDPVLRWFNKYHWVPMLILGIALFLMGGWPFVVWGVFLRSVVVYHGTWCVNSASHIWGYQSYKTTDTSRNNWWVALWTFGEGWHNNHHMFARSAKHGLRWWELDVTYRMIQVLWVLGLATNIHLPVKPEKTTITVPVIDLSKAKQLIAKTASQLT